MLRTAILLVFMMIITGCAPKVKWSTVWPAAYTYPEERQVLDHYPIEPIQIEELNVTAE